MAELDLMLGKPPKLAAAQQGQNQSLTSSRLPPQSSRRCSAFNLQEASFPWQQCFRGIFGTLPPEGPCAHDAHAATSALAPGPGCRQACSPSHCQAGDELPAQRGLDTLDPQQQLRLRVLRELGIPRGAPLAAPLVTQEGGVGPCVLHP